MKKSIINLGMLLIVTTGFMSCLKSNALYTDYGSTQPIADIPKAPGNTVSTSTAPTSSWQILDTTKSEVDYLTAVHLSANSHVGDVTLKMKIDVDAANAFIARVPYTIAAVGTKRDTIYYKVLPPELYTVPSYDVTIANAGVFSTGDFNVRIKIGTKDANGENLFNHTIVNKHFYYILPITIVSAGDGKYAVASNFQTILWRIRVK
ncbi:MAG: DUF1735 domain-containing protein [Ginsengibacter sp.]